AQTGNRPTWRSVTIWRKVQSGDDVAVMNEVFADFPRISKGLESSQEWAFAIMLRRLADSHSGVYSPNQEPEFREVFDEAVRLANQKLLVD
ncbi:MAG TPA: hypothetical protein VN673_04910, partial [Clostridia bacterium]|nr:hypothetical protein [Clostridia bacterium]